MIETSLCVSVWFCFVSFFWVSLSSFLFCFFFFSFALTNQVKQWWWWWYGVCFFSSSSLCYMQMGDQYRVSIKESSPITSSMNNQLSIIIIIKLYGKLNYDVFVNRCVFFVHFCCAKKKSEDKHTDQFITHLVCACVCSFSLVIQIHKIHEWMNKRMNTIQQHVLSFSLSLFPPICIYVDLYANTELCVIWHSFDGHRESNMFGLSEKHDN